MRLSETKIYFKFIGWFLLVAILPLFLLFFALFRLQPDSFIFQTTFLNNVLFSIFSTSALVLTLALIAARHFSYLITKPVKVSIDDLEKVIGTLKKSIDNLAESNKHNKQIASLLFSSTKDQQKGLNTGDKAVGEIVQSLSLINQNINRTQKNTSQIKGLANEGESKAQLALSSLVAIKHLSTENQKLNQALASYAGQVSSIAERVDQMAEAVRYLSLNASIEAAKSEVSLEFEALVHQVRQINSISQEAALGIKKFATSMQQQIKNSENASQYELKEADKNIGIVGQTIQFLAKITKDSTQISKNIDIICSESGETKQAADQVTEVIKNLGNNSKNLVKEAQNVNHLVEKQSNNLRVLRRSFNILSDTVANLAEIVEKN
ncbi:methyl-accepting chemotaxis protein [Candidatus Nomurabacteria bacterium]|nr:methyl-accepting chemotaxis protein [Candidatus Nomurabacteria bacterium]